MNENSLSPQPSGVACPNCGAVQSMGVACCTNCGAAIAPAKSSFSLAVAAKFGVAALLFTGAAGFGALGAFLFVLGALNSGQLIGMMSETAANSIFDRGARYLVIAGVLAVVGVVWSLVWGISGIWNIRKK